MTFVLQVLTAYALPGHLSLQDGGRFAVSLIGNEGIGLGVLWFEAD